jgi:hypothetical protein
VEKNCRFYCYLNCAMLCCVVGRPTAGILEASRKSDAQILFLKEILWLLGDFRYFKGRTRRGPIGDGARRRREVCGFCGRVERGRLYDTCR